jgi:hypothetical protein
MTQITGGSSSLPDRPRGKSIARKGVALVVLFVLAVLALDLVVHVVLAVATGLLIVVAVVAAIWAARVLL